MNNYTAFRIPILRETIVDGYCSGNYSTLRAVGRKNPDKTIIQHEEWVIWLTSKSEKVWEFSIYLFYFRNNHYFKISRKYIR
jgi:hypothetical protein